MFRENGRAAFNLLIFFSCSFTCASRHQSMIPCYTHVVANGGFSSFVVAGRQGEREVGDFLVII